MVDSGTVLSRQKLRNSKGYCNLLGIAQISTEPLCNIQTNGNYSKYLMLLFKMKFVSSDGIVYYFQNYLDASSSDYLTSGDISGDVAAMFKQHFAVINRQELQKQRNVVAARGKQNLLFDDRTNVVLSKSLRSAINRAVKSNVLQAGPYSDMDICAAPKNMKVVPDDEDYKRAYYLIFVEPYAVDNERMMIKARQMVRLDAIAINDLLNNDDLPDMEKFRHIKPLTKPLDPDKSRLSDYTCDDDLSQVISSKIDPNNVVRLDPFPADNGLNSESIYSDKDFELSSDVMPTEEADGFDLADNSELESESIEDTEENDDIDNVSLLDTKELENSKKHHRHGRRHYKPVAKKSDKNHDAR